MSELNWRAINRLTGESCGHKHHSKESAERCAEVLGWERFYVETYDGGRTRYKKTHTGSKKYKFVDDYNRRTGVVMTTQVSPKVEMNMGKEE